MLRERMVLTSGMWTLEEDRVLWLWTDLFNWKRLCKVGGSKLLENLNMKISSRFAVTPCVISTIAKLRYRFWKEPNRTTRISTVAKWEIWFRREPWGLHGFFSMFRLACSNLRQENEEVWRCSSLSSICWDYVLNGNPWSPHGSPWTIFLT